MNRRQLSAFEKHLVEALQVNARASWRKIAHVLRQPERTVARHGTELLESGAVSVTGLHVQQMHVVVELSTVPGASNLAVEALARRTDTSFSYNVTGNSNCVAELLESAERLGDILALELPAISGVTAIETHPVLTYFRTTASWRAGLLSEAQVSELKSGDSGAAGYPPEHLELSAQDQRLLDALVQDGRASYESLGRKAGISESTARRRTERLLQANLLDVRAVVEPSLLGYTVQAFLWIRARPGQVHAIGSELVGYSSVRYAAAIAGRYQLVADVVFQNLGELYSFTTQASWSQAADSIDISVTVGARKRGGRIAASDESVSFLN